MQFLRKGQHQSWIRSAEHTVLRIVSLAFSLGSAHAIRWFFAPLDPVDTFQPAITWMIAIGFGVLGYFVSRGLAHRMMNKERIWAYAPICILVEFVEIFCNYALAAAVIQNATWLHFAPVAQRNVLTFMTYAVLSVIPLVSLLLAVVDMDLERKKHGERREQGPNIAVSPYVATKGTAPGPVLAGKQAPQPKWGNAQQVAAPQTTYPQGYTGVQGSQVGTVAAQQPRGGSAVGVNGANAAPLAGVRPAPQVSPQIP